MYLNYELYRYYKTTNGKKRKTFLPSFVVCFIHLILDINNKSYDTLQPQPPPEPQPPPQLDSKKGFPVGTLIWIDTA